MPVLRYDTGNPGATLIGGVGDALANALNPKTRAEAWLLQQRLMLENLNYQKEQRAYAAQEAARQQFSHVVPPDKMPVIANMIYQGAAMKDIEREAALQSGQLIDATTPEAYAHNREYYIRVFDKLPEGGLIDAGPITTAANNQIRARQAGDVASQTALGTKTGEQIATANPAPGYLAGLAAQKGAEAQATNQAEIYTKGYDLGNGLRYIPDIPGTNPQHQDIFQPTPLGKPQQVQKVVPGGRLVGTSNVDMETNKNMIASNTATLKDAYTQGDAAAKLLTKLQQLADITRLYNGGVDMNSEVGRNITARLASGDFPIYIHGPGDLYAAKENLLKSEIPELRKQAGIQKLAVGDIKPLEAMIGTPNMPYGAMMNVIAGEQVLAETQLERRNEAVKVLPDYGGNGDMDQFIKKDQQLINDYQARVNQRREELGATGTQSWAGAGGGGPQQPVSATFAPTPAPAAQAAPAPAPVAPAPPAPAPAPVAPAPPAPAPAPVAPAPPAAQAAPAPAAQAAPAPAAQADYVVLPNGVIVRQ